MGITSHMIGHEDNNPHLEDNPYNDPTKFIHLDCPFKPCS